ncbi:formate C-acetyltransferase [Geosporobacter ferrireducens]|uniref:Formate C-acetyltransferase n=1 Tax=Geosporobacter ferrireducens TaxID=1424294 RepID=A0A1D8GPW2_9FIRM|nr:formate C-acetyltransferase [Geosporobacter ferrireducens]MTI54886.1 formate C-acetyltransferase [Geosporobacter ferrireducens]
MSKRISELKEQLFQKRREISLERAILYTESWKFTEGEPTVVRRAKALAHILDHVNINIERGELIVGGRTIQPRAGVISPEMSPYWILQELDTLPTRPQDQFDITGADKVLFRSELFPYWKDRSLEDRIEKKIPDHIQQTRKKKIIKLNQTDKGQGHIIPSFEKVLNDGLDCMIAEAASKNKKDPFNPFYDAVHISLLATQRHINRYAQLASSLAAVEVDLDRRDELLEIARISNKIAKEPPHSFYEALQLFWYINIILQQESNASSISPGRFDQYMYPFYQNTIDAKEDSLLVKELLQNLMIKFNTIVALRSEESAKFFAGFPIGYNIILGGVDQKGRDAVNELSYLMLETYADIKLPQPNLGVRIHEKTPREFLIKASETIRLGTGIPQVFNDEVIIPAFLNRGVALKDARDYAVVGCVELSIPGKTYGLHDIALFNLLRVMELTLQGQASQPDCFDSLLDAIKENVTLYIKDMVEGSNIIDHAHGELVPTPFLSAFIDGCMDKGLDVSQGGAIYNFSGVQGIGIANLADSLHVVKKLIFEDNGMNLSQLVELLENNYAGQETLRQRFIHRFDKYGNDIDAVDYLGSEILTHYCTEVEKYTNARGGIFQPGSYTVSAHIPLGEAVGATPDGRLAKEQLADGGLSPMVGRDRLGPTASLKSVSKLDHYLLSNGSLLNVKFSPSALEGEEGIKKMIGYLQAFMRLKLQHIQFNVISVELLKDAQKNPDKYKNLVVRVAGYSAIFIELNKAIQDDIINRREHTL